MPRRASTAPYRLRSPSASMAAPDIDPRYPTPEADGRCGPHNQAMDWSAIDTEALFEAIRASCPAPEAERMVWAWEHVLAGARVDPALLDHLAAAAICGLAYRDHETPRAIS